MEATSVSPESLQNFILEAGRSAIPSELQVKVRCPVACTLGEVRVPS